MSDLSCFSPAEAVAASLISNSSYSVNRSLSVSRNASSSSMMRTFLGGHRASKSSCQSFIINFIMPLGGDRFSRGTRGRCQSLVRDERPSVHKPLQNHCSTSKIFVGKPQPDLDESILEVPNVRYSPLLTIYRATPACRMSARR